MRQSKTKRARTLILIGGILLLLSFKYASAQTRQTGKGQLSTYANQPGGFKFQYQGTLVKRSQNDFLIELQQSANGGNGRGRVHIFVSQQPFVYLPGTFGGRYYFDADKNSNTTSDYIRGDSVTVDGLKFQRDYWAVYAGMGQWETVDNCYAFHDGQYYTISLTRDFQTGMPGQKVNGVATSKAQMRAGLIEKMHDSTNVYVKSFNQILGSFSITK